MNGQGDSWAISSLWREAIKNVFSGASRLVFVLALALASGVFSSLVSAWQWNSFVQSLDLEAAKGRNVLVFQGSDVAVPTTIDRSSCEALATQPGVLRAGAMTLTRSVEFPQLGPAVQVFRVSSTLAPGLNRVDALVGAQLDYASRDRRLLLPDGGTAVVSQDVAEPDGLNLGTAIAVPFDPGDNTANQCVVILSRYSDPREAAPRLSSSLSASGGTLSSSDLYPDHGRPLDDFVNRLERLLPVFLGILCSFASLTVNRFRSSDIAIYRFSGTSWRSAFLLLYFEQVLLAGAFVVSGCLVTAVLHSYFVMGSAQVLWCCAGGAAWVLLSFANLTYSRGDPSSLSKDR